MPSGSGKYNDEAVAIIKTLEADVLLLGIVGGLKGTGFEVMIRQDAPDFERLKSVIPAALRAIADEMERDNNISVPVEATPEVRSAETKQHEPKS